jgi:hypothetical protein
VPRFQQIYGLDRRVAWGSDSDVRHLGLASAVDPACLHTERERRVALGSDSDADSNSIALEALAHYTRICMTSLITSEGFKDFLESQSPELLWSLGSLNYQIMHVDGSLCSHFFYHSPLHTLNHRKGYPPHIGSVSWAHGYSVYIN